MKYRVAWGLAVVLSVVVLTGIGAVLYHGVSLGGVRMRVGPPAPLRAIATISEHRTEGFWEGTRYYDLRFCWVLVSRRYFQPELPPEVARQLGIKPDGRPLRTAPPNGTPASTRSGTGR